MNFLLLFLLDKPSSGQERELRDHIGWVWYQTHIYSDKFSCLCQSDTYKNCNVKLRFGGINYHALVVRGVLV